MAYFCVVVHLLGWIVQIDQVIFIEVFLAQVGAVVCSNVTPLNFFCSCTVWLIFDGMLRWNTLRVNVSVSQNDLVVV